MRGIHSYHRSKVNNAPKQQIVTMLLQNATRRLTRVAGIEGRFGSAEIADLGHVRAIFTELNGALDENVASDLVQQLGALYRWCILELTIAGREHCTERVGAVLKVTENLLEGWVAATSNPTGASS